MSYFFFYNCFDLFFFIFMVISFLQLLDIQSIVFIYDFLMQKQNRLNRSRPLFEKCNNERTDRLYFPLRQALIQSSRSKQKSCINYNNAKNDLKCSTISQKAKMIDPVQAEYLIQSIYIPSYTEFIATKDLQKVISKSFVAIQTNIKQNAPISQDEFLARQKNANSVQKIVYEASLPNNQYFFNNGTERIRSTSNLIKNGSTDNSHIKSQSVYTQKSHNRFSQYTQCTQRKEKAQQGNSLSSYFLSREKQSKNPKIITSDFTTSIKQQLKQKQSPYYNNSLTKNTQNAHKQINQIKVGKLSKNLTQSSKSGISLTNQQQINNLSRFAIVTQSEKQMNNSGINKSDNKNKTRFRGLKVMADRTKYKYNLFSCLDQPVNTGCGSCGKVQIFAEKKQYIWG